MIICPIVMNVELSCNRPIISCRPVQGPARINPCLIADNETKRVTTQSITCMSPPGT